MLEKTLESPLDSKDVQPVHPKGNQSWTFIERTDAKVQAPVLWPPDVKSWLIWKDPHAGNDWKQEEKGTTEDEMVGQHYRLDGHDFEQAPGVGDGQGSLACCSPLGLSQTPLRDWTDWLSDWCFIVVAQLLSCVRLLATPWTIACQSPLFFTVSQSLLDSCPLSHWCYPTISSSAAPFSFQSLWVTCIYKFLPQALFDFIIWFMATSITFEF